MLSDARTLKQLIRPGSNKFKQDSKSEIAISATELTFERLLSEKGSKMRLKMENSLQVQQTIFL